TCTIWRVYDQSDHGNHLDPQTTGSPVGGAGKASQADRERLTVGGYPVYSLYTRPQESYWHDGSQSGMPLGAEPQGIYMVTSGEHNNGGCCFDYGNGQLSRVYEGGPTMDSIYFGTSTTWGHGGGSGPWIMADYEDGMLIYGQSGANPDAVSWPQKYVTAMERNNSATFALKGADATQGTLSTIYDGALPSHWRPMKKQGGVLMGAGGDCCLSNTNMSEGTFYEGAIVAGYPDDATQDAVQANIVTAGYGK
ncbi:MAG: alpha-L-arabinofuranosidase, partial [Deltaproteobacteria bacterium]|nr:alpha-L-arabinofuranosidase [Deltaproteobacteria bacterium]